MAQWVVVIEHQTGVTEVVGSNPVYDYDFSLVLSTTLPSNRRITPLIERISMTFTPIGKRQSEIRVLPKM